MSNKFLSNIISIISFHIAPAPNNDSPPFARRPAAHPIVSTSLWRKGHIRQGGLLLHREGFISTQIFKRSCLEYVQDRRKCSYIASNGIKARCGPQICRCCRGHLFLDHIEETQERGFQWGSSAVIFREAMAFKQVWTFSSCRLSLTPGSRPLSPSAWWDNSWIGPPMSSPATSSPWTEPSLLLQRWPSLLSGLGAEEGVTSALEEGGECNICSPPTGTTGSKLQACCWEWRGRWLRMFWWWELAAAGRLEAKLLLWSWNGTLAALAVWTSPGAFFHSCIYSHQNQELWEMQRQHLVSAYHHHSCIGLFLFLSTVSWKFATEKHKACTMSRTEEIWWTLCSLNLIFCFCCFNPTTNRNLETTRASRGLLVTPVFHSVK